METTLTPQIVRDKALLARVPLSHLLDKAGVPGSTFYRWENGGEMRSLTKARIWDAINLLSDARAQGEQG